VHNQGITGQGITVAVIDTGIFYDHPGLAAGRTRRVLLQSIAELEGPDMELNYTILHDPFPPNIRRSD
jgi:subtilisin family serine protease